MCTSLDSSICTELSYTMYIYVYKNSFRLFCTSTIYYLSREPLLMNISRFLHIFQIIFRLFCTSTINFCHKDLLFGTFSDFVSFNKTAVINIGTTQYTLSVTCSMVSVVFCSMSQRRTSSSCMRSPSYREGILHTHPT